MRTQIHMDSKSFRHSWNKKTMFVSANERPRVISLRGAALNVFVLAQVTNAEEAVDRG